MSRLFRIILGSNGDGGSAGKSENNIFVINNFNEPLRGAYITREKVSAAPVELTLSKRCNDSKFLPS